MPCKSDHMSASEQEREASRIIVLLDELDGKGAPQYESYGNGYDNRTYNRMNQEKLDALTDKLCKRITAIEKKTKTPIALQLQEYSFYLRFWWEHHQAGDIRRAQESIESKEREKEQKRLQTIRKKAYVKLARAKHKGLLSLTEDEREAIGNHVFNILLEKVNRTLSRSK